jgi:hypothetical protein
VAYFFPKHEPLGLFEKGQRASLHRTPCPAWKPNVRKKNFAASQCVSEQWIEFRKVLTNVMVQHEGRPVDPQPFDVGGLQSRDTEPRMLTEQHIGLLLVRPPGQRKEFCRSRRGCARAVKAPPAKRIVTKELRCIAGNGRRNKRRLLILMEKNYVGPTSLRP